MKINEVKYERKFNLGNYESEMIAVGAAVSENEDPGEVLQQLKQFVHSGGAICPTTTNEPAITEEANIEPPKEKRTRKKKEDPDVDKTAESAPDTESDPQEAPPKAKTKVKSAATKYDRTNDLHKKLLTDLLDKNKPGWKANASASKEASAKVNGEPFLDSEGLVLPEFKEKFLQLLK